MYENPPPMVETYDKLSNSYETTGRPVTATFSDLGVPLDSAGVVEGWTHYRIDGGIWDSLLRGEQPFVLQFLKRQR